MSDIRLPGHIPGFFKRMRRLNGCRSKSGMTVDEKSPSFRKWQQSIN
jgi:hypothetical protein